MMRNSNKNGNAVICITAGKSGLTFVGNVAVRSLRWDDKKKISELLGYPYTITFKSEYFETVGEKDENYMVLTENGSVRPFPAIIIEKFYEEGDEEIIIDADEKDDSDFIKYAIDWYMTDASFDVTDLEIGPEDARLLTKIGFACEKGMGIDKDFNTARTLYTLAGNAGDAEALDNLAGLYVKGLGVKKNDVIAEELYKIAAKSGLTRALIDLGTLYASRSLSEEDCDKAVKCFKAAAEMKKESKIESEQADLPLDGEVIDNEE